MCLFVKFVKFKTIIILMNFIGIYIQHLILYRLYFMFRLTLKVCILKIRILFMQFNHLLDTHICIFHWLHYNDYVGTRSNVFDLIQ